MSKSILQAYNAIVESQCNRQPVDEDEEVHSGEVLNRVAEGLRDLLNKIEKHTAKPSRLRSGVKTLRIPDEPSGSSWLPSIK